MSNKDDLLIDGLLNGDLRSFEKVYNKYVREMYFLAVGYLRDSNDAQDIVQETFLYLWNNRTSLHPDSNLHSYLRTIIRNSSLNSIRNQRIHDKHKKIIESETYYSQASVTLLSSTDLEESEKDFERKLIYIKEKLEQLPPGCKKAFILSVIEGYTYKQVADKMGVSINTVKTQIKIAYRKIRH